MSYVKILQEICSREYEWSYMIYHLYHVVFSHDIYTDVHEYGKCIGCVVSESFHDMAYNRIVYM